VPALIPQSKSTPVLPKLLVSACLLGNPVRYDGKAKKLDHDGLGELLKQGLAGDGDAVIAGNARVKTRDGEDVTDYFLAGAKQALAVCHQHDIAVAVLTETSPSCGSGQIYDGSFSRQPIVASGVTTALLQQHGIRVFNQHQLDEALNYLASCKQITPPTAAR